MDTYVFRKLWGAFEGYLIWKKIEKKYPQTEKFIFFPEIDNEYNFWGFHLLPEYMKKKNIHYVTVLMTKENWKNQLEENSRIRKEFVRAIDLEHMLSFYALWNMSSKWTVVSTKKPYDTGAERLLGKKNVTIKDIVTYDVYQL